MRSIFHANHYLKDSIIINSCLWKFSPKYYEKAIKNKKIFKNIKSGAENWSHDTLFSDWNNTSQQIIFKAKTSWQIRLLHNNECHCIFATSSPICDNNSEMEHVASISMKLRGDAETVNLPWLTNYCTTIHSDRHTFRHLLSIFHSINVQKGKNIAKMSTFFTALDSTGETHTIWNGGIGSRFGISISKSMRFVSFVTFFTHVSTPRTRTRRPTRTTKNLFLGPLSRARGKKNGSGKKFQNESL